MAESNSGHTPKKMVGRTLLAAVALALAVGAFGSWNRAIDFTEVDSPSLGVTAMVPASWKLQDKSQDTQCPRIYASERQRCSQAFCVARTQRLQDADEVLGIGKSLCGSLSDSGVVWEVSEVGCNQLTRDRLQFDILTRTSAEDVVFVRVRVDDDQQVVQQWKAVLPGLKIDGVPVFSKPNVEEIFSARPVEKED